MFFVQVDGTEVYRCDNPLPKGMTGASKQKFAVAQQEAIFNKILEDFESGVIARGDWTKGEIELLRPATVIANRFWHEVVWDVFFPPKREGGEPVLASYRWIEWNVGSASGAAALCLTRENQTVLVENYRHASREWRIEIPRGIRRQNEDLLDCSVRESLEEAGVLTRSGEIIDLGVFEPDSGLARMTPSLFVIKDVEVDPSKVRRDVSESIAGNILLPVERVLSMIDNGEIVDSYTEVALTRAIRRNILTL